MSSLFLSGALLIVTNRDLVKSGIKPTDFIKKKLPKGTKPELDVGSRLDVEYELKQAGEWDKNTKKLSDEALLDKLHTMRQRKEAEAELAKIESQLSPDAKAELERMRQGKTPEEVWGLLERQDAVKYIEGRARSKREAAAKKAASDARFAAAQGQLQASGFLNRPLIKEKIAAKDVDGLRGQIGEHLAELQAKKDFASKDGYRVLDDVEVVEQFGNYKTKEEAVAADPKAKDYALYAEFGKVWRRLTNLDVLVVRDVKGKKKADVSRYIEVKSGKHDSQSKAKRQQQKAVDALARIAAGDKTVRLHQHRHKDITDTVDAGTAKAGTGKVAGPDDKGFEMKLGVTKGELKRLAKQIVEDAHK